MVLQPDSNQAPRESKFRGVRQTAARLICHPRTSELFGIDLRGLAVFRIALALLLLVDLASRAPFLVMHYTDAGLVTRKLMIERMSKWTLSLYWMNGTTTFVVLMFLIAAAFALMMLVGYRTRLATIVSWVMLVSLHYRNPLVGSAGDHVLRLLMFWGMFLPLGACGSVDSRLCRDEGTRPPARSVLSMATFGLLLQIAFIYSFSAMLKTNPIWRGEGTAIYYALNLDRMTTPFGRWLLQFPELCRVMTFGTLGLEAVGPLLAFLPWGTRELRTITVAIFWSFHIGLALTMHLILFPYVCMAAWVVFLPPAFWDWVTLTRAGVALTGFWPSLLDRLAGVVELGGESFTKIAVCRKARSKEWLLNVTAGLCLLYIVGCNVHSVTKKSNNSLPKLGKQLGLCDTAIDAIAGIGSTFGISQGWIMFSPYPPRDDGWWVVEATLADGSRVDLYRDGRPISQEKPVSIAGEFPSHRCRKYMMSLWTKNRRYHAPHYARWIREKWDESHSGEKNVETLRLYFMLEYTQPPGESPLHAKLLVYRWSDDGHDRLVSYRSNKREYKKLLESDD